MGVFVALLTVLVTLLLPFLDKIVSYFSSKKSSEDIEDEFNLVMSENDNSGFHSHLD